MISFRQLSEISADVVAVHAEAFTPGWTTNAFQELLNKPTTRLYAAYDGSALKALVLAAVILPECEILTVATAPTARRKGIGRGLMQHMLTEVAQAGVEDVHLEVATDNEAAIGLYHGLGFQKAGLRKAYYDRRPAPPVDALVLKLNIPAL